MRNGWLMVLLMAGGLAHAASFDCAKAKTAQEKAICGSPELSAADDRMAAAYRDVLAAVTPEIAAELRDEQRAWIRGMGVKCGQQGAADLAKCLLDYESARTKDLQGKVSHENGMTFVWLTTTMTTPDDADRNYPEFRRLEINPGYGTLIAAWPQAVSDAPEWSAWNGAIVAAAQKFAMRGVKDAGGNSQLKWTANEAEDEEINIVVGYVSEQMVTAAVYDHLDEHGAHANDFSIQFNWLLKERRALRPEDVFKTGSDWEGMMQKSCDQYLHQKLDENGQSYDSYPGPDKMAKTLHGIVADQVNWQLNGKGLTIIFPPYAVACYACTPAPLTISWAAMQSYLQPGFVVPK